MFDFYINNSKSILLLAFLFFVALSILFHLKQKNRTAVLLLFCGAIFFYLFAVFLDPFLNVWDECFHALVSKNFINHPLKPTLFDNPVVNTSYNDWDRYHIWLHKQPLFMWQIALSLKMFGINEYALRIPSALMASLMVLIGYRSAKLMINSNTGYYTAFLFATSFYLLQLVSGRQMLEHDDLAFMFYVSASIWAWLEYVYSEKKCWIYLIGIFSGFAILCKWLPGLLVYLAWFTFIILHDRKKLLKKYKPLALSFIIAVVIALPWQIFTFIRYPAEAKAAYGFNFLHFSEAIDGHTGTFFYHFLNINLLYGFLSAILIIPSFFIFYKKTKNKPLVISLFVIIAFVYLFFSIVKTKMPSFTIIVILPVFISIASLIDYLFHFLFKIKYQVKYILITLLLLLWGYYRIDLKEIYQEHSLADDYYKKLLKNSVILKSLKTKLPPNTVVFNVRGVMYLDIMFYSGLTSYWLIPSEEQYNDMIKKKRKVAIFKYKGTVLPEYIKNKSDVIILNDELVW